jgi:hypothetical protein
VESPQRKRRGLSASETQDGSPVTAFAFPVKPQDALLSPWISTEKTSGKSSKIAFVDGCIFNRAKSSEERAAGDVSKKKTHVAFEKPAARSRSIAGPTVLEQLIGSLSERFDSIRAFELHSHALTHVCGAQFRLRIFRRRRSDR